MVDPDIIQRGKVGIIFIKKNYKGYKVFLLKIKE